MAGKGQRGLATIAALPWPAGIVLGLLGYIVIRHGVGWAMHGDDRSAASTASQFAGRGAYALSSWVALAACWATALGSFLGNIRLRALARAQSDAENLLGMRWREFDLLAGEAFRRHGYLVTETSRGDAEGGIDLILRKDGRMTLVQCKQWQSRKVSIEVVRDMFALLTHHGAAAIKIVALGDYTPEARRFARGKPIELIHSARLLTTAHAAQQQQAPATFLESPLALFGSMAGAALLITVLTHLTQPRPIVPAIPDEIAALMPVAPPYPPSPDAGSRPAGQGTARLQAWKQKNGQSIAVLENSAPDVP